MDSTSNYEKCMAESATDENNVRAQGGAGDYGFAKTVYRYVLRRVEETEHQAGRESHRFFVYHPTITGTGAFHELIREKLLPETFCAKSVNLGKFCQDMLLYREMLSSEAPQYKDIVFHLLITGWYAYVVEEPLHFPDELQPFR